MATLDIDSAIRSRAYEYWKAEGELPGRDLDYWLKAEAEIRAVTQPAEKKPFRSPSSTAAKSASPSPAKSVAPSTANSAAPSTPASASRSTAASPARKPVTRAKAKA